MSDPLPAQMVEAMRLQQPLSRVELSRRLAIAPSTAGIHVDRLLEQGFLRVASVPVSSPGRPPVVLELNPEAGQFIGIDLDSRSIRGVSVDFAQRLLRDRSVSLKQTANANEVTEQIAATIEDVRDQSRPLLAIGLGVPGIFDAERGVALHYAHIRGWTDLPLADRFGNQFEVPVHLENNIRAMALAERWFGQGRDSQNYLCVGIRSGIGAGVFVNGELYRGTHGLAGEIGRWPIPNGESDAALEDVASISSLLQSATEAIASGRKTSMRAVRQRVSWDSFHEAVDSGDTLACEILQKAAQHLGAVLASLTLVLDPEKILIAGPLQETGNRFLDALQATLLEHLPAVHARTPAVAYSELGDLVGAFGAAGVAVHAWQPTETAVTTH
ncbi:ROK family transcriptional regulator [Rubinisphaera margarita]|uniref:ROK family transcriptional regulator n=1 Tax=Rubinisphaera margarita TaxID=2909586 RepID=UPI001EE806F1|nr:ROK family transcriptional regulator [Rubinisphaera margarita]MCG6155557.1 ROK family transcriptional regulator [Rubinisphaera margarita]